jgi:uncharacterized protein YggE
MGLPAVGHARRARWARLLVGGALLLVLPGAATLALTSTPAGATSVTTTLTTEGESTYAVPAGVTELTVTVVGAAGDAAQQWGRTSR